MLLEQLVDLCAQGALALQEVIHEGNVKAGQLADCKGRGGLRRHSAAARCRLGAAAGAGRLVAFQLPLQHRDTSGAHRCHFRGHTQCRSPGNLLFAAGAVSVPSDSSYEVCSGPGVCCTEVQRDRTVRMAHT